MARIKKIPGYDGRYSVSDQGEVFNQYGKRLASWDNGTGLLYVGFCDGYRKRNYAVSRLVAQAFIPNPDNLPVVKHRDGDKSNNCVTNLMWCASVHG